MVSSEDVRLGHMSNGFDGRDAVNGEVEPPPPAGAPGAPVYAGRYRPVVQQGVRVALWAAVAVGCVGGIVTLLGVGGRDAEAVPAAPDDGGPASPVPAPVAGTAELAVEEWLSATEDDGDRLAELFIEPVALSPADESGPTGHVDVRRVRTVAGHLVQDGYWVVTVLADVVEPVDGQAQPPATWFVEVGVVGDPGGGLAALSTPGIMPASPPSFEGWRSSRPSLEEPSDDDPLAVTVEGFLRAHLAGYADPAPYLAPGAGIPVGSSPPFADVALVGIATDEQEGGDLHVWADVLATTPGGYQQPAAYELIVAPRADGWEIEVLWGAPSLGSAPEGQGLAGGASGS